MTVGESRAIEFANELKSEVKVKFDGVGVGTDYLIRAGGEVAQVGGLLFGVSAQSEDATWEDVSKACDYLQRHLNNLNIGWEMNDSMERRKWEDGPFRKSPPYAEIVTAEITENHLNQFRYFPAVASRLNQ